MPSPITADQPRLLLFPASLRRASHQRRLIAWLSEALAAGALPAGWGIDILAPEEVALPLYNQDLEGDDDLRARLAPLHRRFAAACGFVIATPEYNGHVPPLLKNTVDWLSRWPAIAGAAANPFHGRPLLLASASTGWTGGVLGLRDARSVFSYLGCLVSPAQICVCDAENWLEDNRFHFDPGFDAWIRGHLADFTSLAATLLAAQSNPS